MNIQRKLFYHHGIKMFLNKYELPFSIHNEKKLNNLYLDFAKYRGTLKEFTTNNSPNYRGNNKPVINNSLIISDDFDEFKKYINSLYKRKLKSN